MKRENIQRKDTHREEIYIKKEEKHRNSIYIKWESIKTENT